jgi:TPR repeat protein
MQLLARVLLITAGGVATAADLPGLDAAPATTTVQAGEAAPITRTPASPSPALQAAVRAYEARRYVTARLAFERLAHGGDAAAQHNLAVMHLRGELPQPDLRQALALLEQSAAGGFVTAKYALGQLYESGRLGRPDPRLALGWYLQAAEAGSVDAQVEVATAYYLGRGVGADAAAAAGWYRRAATAGEVGAQYLLASMYETGLGVAADPRLAHYWYDVAGRNGDMAAALKARAIAADVAPPADTQASPPRP